jgi:hypothetical protein
LGIVQWQYEQEQGLVMSKIYARPLPDLAAIGEFLDKCLGIRHRFTTQDGTMFTVDAICGHIRDAVGAVEMTSMAATLTSNRNRVPEYRSEASRSTLRERIVEELATLDRIDSDEHISLGRGGAKPIGAAPAPGAVAYLLTGLPASGKSALVSQISDRLGAMVLDSDYAKRKLPEFGNSLAGANLVHEESASIVFGAAADAASLFDYCTSQRLNVVVPQIGHNEVKLKAVRDSFLAKGYEVHLTTTLIDRAAATRRALSRFLETGRYVPLALIFDGYANDPIMNYYKIWTDVSLGRDSGWKSLGAVEADKTVHSSTSPDNPANLIGT